MKSDLSIKPAPKEPPPFPSLYQHNEFGVVVLFTDNYVGTVLTGSTKTKKLGDHATDWIPCVNTNHWTRLPAGTQIVLTQE